MSRDDILRMAREAGFVLSSNATDEAMGRFERFAALDAACAKLEKERDELLGALKWISKRCPAYMEGSLLHPIHQEMAHDAGACARAAIAKATGGQA